MFHRMVNLPLYRVKALRKALWRPSQYTFRKVCQHSKFRLCKNFVRSRVLPTINDRLSGASVVRPFPTHPSTLKEKTQALAWKRLRNTTIKDLSDQTGLSPTWLHTFAQGKIKLADVGKVQKLYEFLTNKKLDV